MNLADRLSARQNGDVEQIVHELDARRDLSLHERLAEPAADVRPKGSVDPYAKLKTRIHRLCIAGLGASLFGEADGPELRQRVEEVVAHHLELDPTPLSQDERQQLIREISDDVLGYGPLEPFLDDPSVTEIMVNGSDTVYVERGGVIEETDSAFIDEEHLLRIIDRIVSQVGRRIDEASPMVDARLPDGSRVNAIIPPLALRGPTLTIRKFSREFFTLEDLVAGGTLSPVASAFLAACVRGKLNVLISGGTGVGKTTLLNALSAHIPEEERIITIEDAAELQLQQAHVVPLEARPPNIEGQGEVRIRELVRNALRMRPDRMIVGEVRGPETLDMLQAMNTGHEGSLTTIHANSPRDALSRLEMLVLTAGVDLPLRAIREQIASAFDVLIQITRLIDGERRISHITEVVGMESDVITLQDVFVARPPSDDELETGGSLLSPLTSTGLVPGFLDKLVANGVSLAPQVFDPTHAEELVVAAMVRKPGRRIA
jgi:pilus assembly protein CpaF